MSKTDDVRASMMAALKAGDRPRKDALSLLLSALKAKRIDKREDLSEDEENAVVLKEIKEARETIDTTPKDRIEIIEECKARIAVYGEFAPKLMDETEIRAQLQAVLEELHLDAPTPRDKGLLMKALMPKLAGKADGALVNRIVGETLK